MKKDYVNPVSTEVELYPETLMVTISGEQSGAGVGGGSTDDGDPDLTNGRDFDSGGSYWE